MRERTERKHVIDFLFPLALFFVLTATSVALVVLASGTYSRQVQDSEDCQSHGAVVCDGKDSSGRRIWCCLCRNF